MFLVAAIDAVVLCAILGVALAKGLEGALPLAAFVLTIFPTESRLPVPGVPDITTARLATALLLVLYLAVGRRPVDEPPRRVPLKTVMLLLLSWTVLSTLNSVDFTASLKTLLSNVLDFYVVYYVFVQTITKSETVEKILRAFVAALLTCCLLGLVEVYFHWSVIGLFPRIVHHFIAGEGGIALDTGRVHSTFPHAILFGNALALGIPWALYLLPAAGNLGQRVWLWFAIALMSWNLYKTMSRGPWLALLLSLVLLFALARAGIRKPLAAVAILALSVLVVRRGVWDSIKNTYSETLDADNPRGSSYHYRYDLMHAARVKLAHAGGPAIWGFGPGTFFDLDIEGVDSATRNIKKFESCDSAFVDVMLGTGYVGLLLVIALLCEPARTSLAGFRRLARPGNVLCLVFFINIAAFAFMMVSVMNWGWGQQTYMIWIVFALAMAYPRLEQRARELPRGRNDETTSYETLVSSEPAWESRVRPAGLDCPIGLPRGVGDPSSRH